MPIRPPKIGNPTRSARGQDVIVTSSSRTTQQQRDQLRKLLEELEQEPEDGEIPPPDAA